MFFIALGLSAHPTYGLPGDPCDLPVDLRSVVFQKFPGTSVAHLTDLNEEDRKLYTKDHGAQCPGLASADFYGDGKPTWAMVLISGEKLARKAQLIIAHQIDGVWKLQALKATDGPTPVVWSDKSGKYEDIYGRKTIHAAHPVLVFCGYESWAVVYSWNGKTIEKVWLSD
jgi:hypothetical protein